MKVKNLLILFLSFLPLLASADPVEIDGIYYNLLENNKAEVTHGAVGVYYSGTVNIPASFTYDKKEYNVTSIGDDAFRICSNLESVIIPYGITSIGKNAFEGCINLSSINLPNSITTIGEWAFNNCSKSLKSITLPSGLKEIAYSTFYDCRALEHIDIPNSVETIGYSAFYHCESLDDVIIPSSVTTIESKAFEGCDDLINLYCYATTPPTAESNTFEDIQFISLHVRANMKETYAAVAPWNKFKKIVEQCATPTISYADHKLSFECETEGVEFVYEITDEDIKSGTANEVELTVTYNVSVYAKKELFDNSEAATATLCWVEQEPVIHTDISEAVEFTAAPVLIQSYGGIVTVQGAADGTPVNIYTTAGTQAGSTVSQHSMARINTNMQPGTIAIIKIGDKSVKTVVK